MKCIATTVNSPKETKFRSSLNFQLNACGKEPTTSVFKSIRDDIKVKIKPL